MKNKFAEKCNRCDNKFMQTVFASLRHKAEGKNDELSFFCDGKKLYKLCSGGFSSFLFYHLFIPLHKGLDYFFKIQALKKAFAHSFVSSCEWWHANFRKLIFFFVLVAKKILWWINILSLSFPVVFKKKNVLHYSAGDWIICSSFKANSRAFLIFLSYTINRV